MVTPNIQLWDAPNLEGCVVYNPVRQIRKAIELIKDEVDVLVGAFHLDLENEFDVPGSGARGIAQEFPELDVILAAHGHKLIEGEMVGDTLVVENLSQGRSLSHVQIVCERSGDGWKVADKSATAVITADYEPDPEIVELLAPYDERAKAFAREIVGRLEGGPLSTEPEIVGIPTPQVEDTALIDLINKVMLHYSGADVSVAELVAPDANIQPGEIRRCDVSKIYKHTNTRVKLSCTRLCTCAFASCHASSETRHLVASSHRARCPSASLAIAAVLGMCWAPMGETILDTLMLAVAVFQKG